MNRYVVINYIVVFIPLAPRVPADVAVSALASFGGFNEVRVHLAGHEGDQVFLDVVAEGVAEVVVVAKQVPPFQPLARMRHVGLTFAENLSPVFPRTL